MVTASAAALAISMPYSKLNKKLFTTLSLMNELRLKRHKSGTFKGLKVRAL
ncbi:hypothetical protein GCM10007879_31290 [Maritalea porphyrae]|uniref:Uncharacterized protein n=1 Tax=Maritalea porphyrae TaxID=880732 RepID=A0ABQ5UVY0_9HYPH|nr:hypothetical protein GCM10007879_31290 [Maritalea porphyrae]